MNGDQANFLQSLGWAVLNSLWQLALLWVAYQLITGIIKKLSSSARSSLATLLLVAGFGWFIYTFFSAFSKSGGEQNAISNSAIVNPGYNPELTDWLEKTLPIASVIYLVLLVFPLLHFTRNYRYVQVIRRYGLTKIEADWRLFVQKIAAQMGIKKTVMIWVSELVSSPVTIGFLKPVILVPLAAVNHLTPQQLEAVLLHELSHIRRFDYLVNLVINFIQAILYFNPFAKAFVKIVEKEREKSCDEMVLQFQYDSHEYASALLTLEKANLTTRPLAVGAGGKKHDLLSRIELILGVRRKPVLSFNKLAGFMAGLLCVIAMNALFIITKPVTGKRAATFASLVVFSENYAKSTAPEVPVTTAERPSTVINDIAKHTVKPVPQEAKPSPAGFMVPRFDDPEFLSASFEVAGVPVLKKYQEEQVKDAMEASKKILENKHWIAFEKSVADVFTKKEKEQLKARYEKEMEKFDWEQWENKLRMAYDKVDWEKVNMQLNNAVTQVRMDSLQHVYVDAIAKLDDVEKELLENNLNSVPDTDISLKKVEQKKKEVQRVLNNLKVVRAKKVVHL